MSTSIDKCPYLLVIIKGIFGAECPKSLLDQEPIKCGNALLINEWIYDDQIQLQKKLCGQDDRIKLYFFRGR